MMSEHEQQVAHLNELLAWIGWPMAKQRSRRQLQQRRRLLRRQVEERRSQGGVGQGCEREGQARAYRRESPPKEAKKQRRAREDEGGHEGGVGQVPMVFGCVWAEDGQEEDELEGGVGQVPVVFGGVGQEDGQEVGGQEGGVGQEDGQEECC